MAGDWITTVVVLTALVQPFLVTEREYVPASATVTFETDAFCVDAVNELGPLQLYVDPAETPEERFNVPPSHKGELLLTVGVAGV